MVLSRAREKGLEADDLVALGEREGMPVFVAAGQFLRGYLDNLDDQSRHRLRRPDPPRGDRGEGPPRRAAAAVPAPVRRRVPGHRPRPGRPAPRPRRRRRGPGRGRRPPPVDLRVPRRRGPRDPRVPRRLPAGRRGARTGRAAADDAQVRAAAAGGDPAGRRPDRAAGHHRRRRARVVPAPRRGPNGPRTTGWPPCSPSTPSAPRPSTSPTCSGVPTSRTASRGTGWPCSCVPAGSASLRCAARSARPASRSRWPATSCRSCRTRPCCPCSARCGPRSTSTTTTRSRPTTSTTPAPSRCCSGRSAASTPATYVGWPGCCAPARRTPPTPSRGCRSPPRSWCASPCCATATSTRSRARRRRPRAPCTRSSARPPTGSPTAARPRTPCGGCGPAPDWPGRLRRSVELGGGGARRAHRDLDSVVALFDVAAREAEKRDVAAVSGAAGVRDFLSRLVAQQIPADTLAEQGVRGAAVRLLTAHRSKGLEWDLVVVAHVQQEGWPDLRRRSTMLQADRIGTDGRGQESWCPRSRPASSSRRSAGSSTSPAPAPARDWSSRPWPRPRTTASSRRGSSPSSASPSRRSWAGRRGRCRLRAW